MTNMITSMNDPMTDPKTNPMADRMTDLMTNPNINLMTDIKEGFIQRRLPDGGFKVQLSFIFFSLDT